MQDVRRLYLYAMAGITLAVIASGLVLLLRVVLDGFLPDPFDEGIEGYDNSREQLSQAIAMLGVGTPVWAVHWWFIQRGLRAGRPERDAERGSSIRAIYVTGVLLISLLVWVISAGTFLQWLATDLLDVVPEYSYLDPLGSITTAVAAFAIWLYHGLVRRRDLAAGPVTGPAAWVPRLYLYGVSIISGYVVLTVIGSVLSSVVWATQVGSDGEYATFYVTQQVVSGIAWAFVWLGHWTYANRLARDPGWRGTDERVSRFRVAAFVTIVVIAAASALINLVTAVNAAIMPLLPVEPGFEVTPDARSIVAPLVSAVLWAVVWWSHGRALQREPAAGDPLRALHQERLVSHGVAAVGLAIGGVGAGWLLGYLFNLVFGGDQTTFAYPSWELAQFVPLTVVGLGTWLWFWRGVVARRRSDPVGEANSTIRRTFLYVTLGVALVVAIAAAAVILYRVVGLVINAGIGGVLVSDLSTPIGALLGAGIVLLYHGLALRSDQRLASSWAVETPAAQPADASDVAEGPPVSAEGSTPSPAVVSLEASMVAVRRRAFALVGPEDELEAALQAARAALPPGIEIIDAEA